jgi:hypothetical protein
LAAGRAWTGLCRRSRLGWAAAVRRAVLGPATLCTILRLLLWMRLLCRNERVLVRLLLVRLPGCDEKLLWLRLLRHGTSTPRMVRPSPG